jgi:hypothetical protein
MGAEQNETDALVPASRVYQGVIGPTGPAPLVPTGVKIRHGVLVQWATGTAWVGGTGVGTGMGHQLGPSGALVDGAFHQVFVKANNVRSVSVNATQGVVRWIAS